MHIHTLTHICIYVCTLLNYFSFDVYAKNFRRRSLIVIHGKYIILSDSDTMTYYIYNGRQVGTNQRVLVRMFYRKSTVFSICRLIIN